MEEIFFYAVKHLISTIFSLVLVKINLLINNARSVKLVPEILVSEGIVIISSISFFIFLVLLIKRVKISWDGTKNFAAVIFRFLMD